MKINLPDSHGKNTEYRLLAHPITFERLQDKPARIALAAAHVVACPFADRGPHAPAAIDWNATIEFRRHLDGLGLGIAEAMDTAQRGSGLDWKAALELIRRTKTELPDALVFNGAGTDHLNPLNDYKLNEIVDAYQRQINDIQAMGGRIILMASRALAKVARGGDDYLLVYEKLLNLCDAPVILHWLGDMFDSELKGYWGANKIDEAADSFLTILHQNAAKVDGIKLSLLDKEMEIDLRRRLPDGVRMYTGDDFNYPELIHGDDEGFHSDALLGIFDPIAPAAAASLNRLTAGDRDGFQQILAPTVPLSRHIFCAPTQYYKTGIVFLAWLNGFQNHFIMVGGAQSMRSLSYFVECFKLADQARLLSDPELAIARMQKLLAIYGA